MKIQITSVIFFALASLVCADEAPGQAQKAILVGKANDDFGLQLLHRLELAEKTERGQKHLSPRNIFISPLSVSSVLAMLMAGGKNVTGEEIKNTLGFEKMTESDVYSAYNTLLKGVKQTTSSSADNILQLANSIALQNNFQLLEDFQNTVRNSFDAQLFNVDFAHNSHKATASINAWVAEKTNNKIEKLFDDDLPSTTALVLLNALFFKGTWRYKFNETKTTPAPFTYEQPNVQAQVPTMTLKGVLKYAHFDDGDLIELPYSDDSLSMLIYLPDTRWIKEYQTIAGQFERFRGRGSVKIAERIASLRNATVNLHLPKFKITGEYKLNEVLQNLGIRTAFSSAKADLSRINGHQNLFLSQVAHKSVVEVNEEGSVAAAATGAVVQLKSMPIVHEFNVNRPFLFLIRDNLHQVTLFSGVVNKP